MKYVAYIYNNEIQSILHSYNHAVLQTLYLKLKFFPSQPTNLSKLLRQFKITVVISNCTFGPSANFRDPTSLDCREDYSIFFLLMMHGIQCVISFGLKCNCCITGWMRC
jgi:hypothetical protein